MELISETSLVKVAGSRDVIQLASLDPEIPRASRPEPSVSSKLIPGEMSSEITSN